MLHINKNKTPRIAYVLLFNMFWLFISLIALIYFYISRNMITIFIAISHAGDGSEIERTNGCKRGRERKTWGMTLISCFCHTFLWRNLVDRLQFYIPPFISHKHTHEAHCEQEVKIEFFFSQCNDMEMNLRS